MRRASDRRRPFSPFSLLAFVSAFLRRCPLPKTGPVLSVASIVGRLFTTPPLLPQPVSFFFYARAPSTSPNRKPARRLPDDSHLARSSTNDGHLARSRARKGRRPSSWSGSESAAGRRIESAVSRAPQPRPNHGSRRPGHAQEGAARHHRLPPAGSDILHLHPAALPQAARVLPRSRSALARRRPADAAAERARRPQPVQGRLCAPHRLAP
ncbi:hypothetical protein CDD83_1324 [Cordyceps sp. RAO-2017]|nr:hypothetical protein CDD83_1324 [Cordyceps sp. RAO-2017]